MANTNKLNEQLAELIKAGEVNHIKIGIADGGDGVWDSNLLIAGDSVQTAVIAEADCTIWVPEGWRSDPHPVSGALILTRTDGRSM